MSINQKIIIAFVGLIGIYFSLSGNVFGVGNVSLISYPDQAEIGEEFTVYFKVESFEENMNYYMKGRIGDEQSINDGETFNPSTSSWLYDTSSWEQFPTLSTNPEGSASAQVQMRAKSTAPLGTNILEIRIRKVGGSTNYDSNQGMITILAAPTATPTPTSSSTPVPTSTPQPTSTSTPTPTPAPSSALTPTIKPTVTPTKKPTTSPTPTLFPVTEGEVSVTGESQQEVLGVQAVTPTLVQSSSLPKILIGTGTLLLVISGGLLFLPHLKR